MQYGLIPQSEQEKEALEQSPYARVLMDPFLPLVTARALMAFVQLGLPPALATKSKSVAELAYEFGLREEGLRPLLRVLVASGYVSLEHHAPKREERFGLTNLSRNTLVDECPAGLHDWVLHNRIHWRVMSTLEDKLINGGKRDLHHYLKNAEEWDIYQRAMLQTARPIAGPIAKLLPEPVEHKLMLDLGGSHGLYGAAICRRFPPMRCRVIDLSEALIHARKLGEAEGIDDIVEYAEGDLMHTELGTDSCDVVFMGNIVHHFDSEKLDNLLARVHCSLKSGGVIAIWDMATPPIQSDINFVTEGFSLMFYLSSASTCRSLDEYSHVLTNVGFTNTEIHRGPSPTHVLITARRN